MASEQQSSNNSYSARRSHRLVMRSESALDLSSDFWMHRHFRAMAALYNSLLAEAGILPGDTVLDLGCGSGTHFEWLADIVGPEGKIIGYDPEADNIDLARKRIAGTRYERQIELQRGSISDELPFNDGYFDSVWCAGSLQYVPQPVNAIREMMRVVRLGGRVAVQDVEMNSLLLGPMPDDLLIGLKGSLPRGWTDPGHTEFVDWLIGHKLRSYFLRAGLREVRGQLRTRVYVPPFTDDELGFLEVAIPYLCTESPGIGNLAYRQVLELQDLVDPDSRRYLLEQPDFIFVEGRALAVGLK